MNNQEEETRRDCKEEIRREDEIKKKRGEIQKKHDERYTDRVQGGHSPRRRD